MYHYLKQSESPTGTFLSVTAQQREEHNGVNIYTLPSPMKLLCPVLFQYILK